MRMISYFFLLAIVLLGMVFAISNSESVTINYYLSQLTLPLSLLLVIVFALGCFVGMLASLCLLIKMKWSQFRLKTKLTTAEKTIENLKTS